jgi:NAD(P)-dependent dehydrogenase (short-subunit alcohol dehydrogenase family)
VAKAAVHGLTRTLTPELGAAGVRINTVLPGWVLTQRQRDLYYDAAGKAMLQQNQPLEGIIEPEDLAAMVLFLGADDSRMCTGQEFTMDGGWA